MKQEGEGDDNFQFDVFPNEDSKSLKKLRFVAKQYSGLLKRGSREPRQSDAIEGDRSYLPAV